MRFHVGMSFNWRTIKKFLIPILLGFLAYFGFNFISDSKSIPFGFIQVNAEELGDYNDISSDDIPDEVENNYNYWSDVLSSNNEIQHKPIHDKIYWFDDNTTELGVLSSIYILLFIYCISMSILKIITIVHNNGRW